MIRIVYSLPDAYIGIFWKIGNISQINYTKTMDDETFAHQSISYLKKTVVTPHAEKIAAPEGSSLFQACSFVAEKMGFSLPLITKEHLTIEEICAFGKIRYRKIELKPNWWNKDHGHFIAFYQKEQKPVAVIFSHRQGKYRLYHPETGESKVIDRTVASMFAPEAFVLYFPLPEEVQKIRGIFSLIFSKIRREMVALFLFGVAVIILGFAFPIANKLIYDFIIPNYNITVYTQLFLGLFVISLSIAIFSFSKTLLLVRIKGMLTDKVQIGLWDRLLRLPIRFFRSFSKGDLLLRTLIFDRIKNQISNSALSLLINGFFSLFYFIIMLFFSWQLTLIGASLIVVWSLFASVILFVKIRYEKKLLASTAQIQAFLVQIINAINKVRTTCLEKRLFSKWAFAFSRNQSLSLKVLHLKNIITSSSTFMGLLLPFSFYSFVIYWKNQSETSDVPIQAISVGTFLAFLAAFTPFSQGLLQMVTTLASLSEIIPFWKRTEPLLSYPVEKIDIGADPGFLKGKIEVNNLHFRYNDEGPLVLQKVNMHLAPGTLIGLVGKTGCGKSTLCRLLFGFETVHPNTIFIDDQDITEVNLLKLRKQMGFVFQENKIFNGNIYDNLTCNRPCTKEELDHVLALTTFAKELEKLPMGLDTRLSSMGGLLSGGQKQKLLLARALLLQPQILLIDEGFNTLDNLTQGQILTNIKSLGKTVLLVTHRVNILKPADQIYVMDAGEIIATGTFEELAHTEGLFKRFLEKQFFFQPS